MRRFALLATVFATSLLAAPAASQAFVTGIGDQQPAMFLNANYPKLKIKDVRYIVSWDAMNHAQERKELAAWFAAAKLYPKTRVLVAFNHSRYGKKSSAPSPKTYGKAVAKFHKKYGKQVNAYQTWNEINHCGSQPKKLCKGASGAKRAAALFKELKKRVKGKTIVAVDLLDGNNKKTYRATAKYAKDFVRFAKKSKPTVFGLHNYSDTNRNSQTRTRFIIKALPKRAKVWVTETGGIASFGKSFPFDLSRQAKATRQAFRIARKNKAIKRLYLYNFSANEGGRFDSGIVDAQGNPRPAFSVVRKRGK